MADTKTKPAKIEFEVDGKKYLALRPNRREEADADLAYKAEFTKLFRAKNLTTDEVEDHLRERGKWGDADAARVKAIDAEIKAKLKVVLRQVAGTTKDELRKACIDVRKLRAERFRLRQRFSPLESLTCEAQAQEIKFNMLVARCVKDEKGKAVFKTVEELMDREATDPLAEKATSAMAQLVYDADPDFFAKLPENVALRAAGWADAKGRLVNERGEYVDEENRRVNEEGRLISPDTGELLDGDGDPVDSEGLPVGPTYPLADEEAVPPEPAAPAAA